MRVMPLSRALRFDRLDRREAVRGDATTTMVSSSSRASASKEESRGSLDLEWEGSILLAVTTWRLKGDAGCTIPSRREGAQDFGFTSPNSSKDT